MSKLTELKPKKKERVIDLLKLAGIAVPKNASQTFLSQWAFIQPHKIVVLNFWYGKQIKQQGENIIVQLRLPKNSKGIYYKEKTVHDAIKLAIGEKLKIRIIVLEGKMGDTSKAAKISKRYLDRAIWHVADYNFKTGHCTLERIPHTFVDQYSARQFPPPKLRDVSGQAFVRRAIVRDNVLLRANGKCEWCKKVGFKTTDGKIFLETHHVVSLSEGGADAQDNVAALCPNHHREAHYGKIRDRMRKGLLECLSAHSN